MTQQRLRELAKQGNAKAIALLVQVGLGLKIHGLRVKATIEQKSLFVYLESDEVPEEQASVKFIYQIVKDLKLYLFNQVEIYGRRKGEKRLAWNSKFQIDRKASFLPKGCILRKATIPDKSEIEQMLLRYNSEIKKASTLSLRKQMLLLFLLLFVGFAVLIGSIIQLVLSILSSDIYEIVSSLLGLLIYNWPTALLLSSVLFSRKNYIQLSNSEVLKFWVIEYNRQLVAFGELEQHRRGSYIRRLFVEKSWRRKGLGSALVKCFIREATRPIEVIPTSESKTLYTQFGFVKNISAESITLIYKD